MNRDNFARQNLLNRASFEVIVPGVTGDRVTPDPIPNSDVKTISADGTPIYRGRVGQCREQ